MEQTAVEWLYNNLKSHFEHDGDLLEVVQFSFEQAKDMERQQLIDCGNSCALNQVIHNRKLDLMNLQQLEEFVQEEHLTFREEYFNETFKNK